jgi:hypothetical protein
VIKNTDGQIFDINMPCITADNKAFARPDKKSIITSKEIPTAIAETNIGISKLEIEDFLNA